MVTMISDMRVKPVAQKLSYAYSSVRCVSQDSRRSTGRHSTRLVPLAETGAARTGRLGAEVEREFDSAASWSRFG